MAQVIVIDNNIEDALRNFKKQVDRDGVLRQLRSRMMDDPKPSVKRKKKARIAAKRRERAARRRGKPVEWLRMTQKGVYSATQRI